MKTVYKYPVPVLFLLLVALLVAPSQTMAKSMVRHGRRELQNTFGQNDVPNPEPVGGEPVPAAGEGGGEGGDDEDGNGDLNRGAQGGDAGDAGGDVGGGGSTETTEGGTVVPGDGGGLNGTVGGDGEGDGAVMPGDGDALNGTVVGEGEGGGSVMPGDGDGLNGTVVGEGEGDGTVMPGDGDGLDGAVGGDGDTVMPGDGAGLDTTPPMDGDGVVDTPAPSPADVDYPTQSYPTYDQPTYDSPTYKPPSEKPHSAYVPTDDDPLQPLPGEEGGGQGIDEGYAWNDSTVEDLEHDRTVLIALGVTFGVGLLLAICTAQQMLENPDGCCASICRMFVACTCAITRCFCYPCRKICGCTGKDRRSHELVMGDHGNYTHDLELS